MSRVQPCIIIRLRRIPIVYQQAVLVGKVVYIVDQKRVIQISEVVRADLEATIVALVGAVLAHIIVVEEGGLCTGGDTEARKSPACLGFGAIRWVTGDVDLIHHKASLSNRSIRPVAEA